jgi:hypothetical protein
MGQLMAHYFLEHGHIFRKFSGCQTSFSSAVIVMTKTFPPESLTPVAFIEPLALRQDYSDDLALLIRGTIVTSSDRRFSFVRRLFASWKLDFRTKLALRSFSVSGKVRQFAFTEINMLASS